MEKILIFIIRVLIQTTMYSYALISSTELILKKKMSKKEVLFNFMLLTISSLITAFLQSKIKIANMIFALLFVFFIGILIQKTNWNRL